ncbi:HET-domain-containing protein [Acephala macrosclerotiorum]|nr:HET-domain-containing protein [Acephala macrosclerotiorum]
MLGRPLLKMDAAKLYANAPLDLRNQQIRLVKIQPGNESEIIQCKFHCFSLLDCPKYVALSYAWGPPRSYKHILLDNTEFVLRRNLWWFLYYARLRNENELLWIDAMCIDQSSNAERSHQIGLMGKIYSEANRVMVWLGEADKSAESDIAMDFVLRRGLAPLRTKAGRFQSLWSQSQGKALLKLCERNYWRRVWVVQEIMHARDLKVFCGSKSFPWQNINQIFQKLRRVDGRGHTVHHQNAAAVLDSPAAVIVKAKSVWHGERVPLLSLLITYRDLQSTEVRDRVIGLLGLKTSSGSRDENLSVSLVDYSISLTDFFWRVLTRIWEDSCPNDRREMSRAAEILKDTLKVYVSEADLRKKIDTIIMSTNTTKPTATSSELQTPHTTTNVNVDNPQAPRAWTPVQTALETPLIGEERSISALMEGSEIADPIYQAEINQIAIDKYSHYRPVSGHHSGWRAISFVYFETLLQLGDGKLFEIEIAQMKSLQNSLVTSSDPIPWEVNQWVETTTTFLQELVEISQLPFQYSEQLLLQRFNDPAISDAVVYVYHFRLLGDSNPQSIRDQGELHLSSLRYFADVLLKIIGISLQLEFSDELESVTHFFHSNENVGGPTICILCRESHYCILYKDQERESSSAIHAQAQPVPTASQDCVEMNAEEREHADAFEREMSMDRLRQTRKRLSRAQPFDFGEDSVQ